MKSESYSNSNHHTNRPVGFISKNTKRDNVTAEMSSKSAAPAAAAPSPSGESLNPAQRALQSMETVHKSQLVIRQKVCVVGDAADVPNREMPVRWDRQPDDVRADGSSSLQLKSSLWMAHPDA